MLINSDRHKLSVTRPKGNGVIKMRKCLRHGGLFESEHIGNRICKPCKNKSKYHNVCDESDYQINGVSQPMTRYMRIGNHAQTFR